MAILEAFRRDRMATFLRRQRQSKWRPYQVAPCGHSWGTRCSGRGPGPPSRLLTHTLPLGENTEGASTNFDVTAHVNDGPGHDGMAAPQSTFYLVTISAFATFKHRRIV